MLFKSIALAATLAVGAPALLQACPNPPSYEELYARYQCEFHWSNDPSYGVVRRTRCSALPVGYGQTLKVNYSDGTQSEGVRATDDVWSYVYDRGRNAIDQRVWFT
jgi:hypothetical protein